MKVFWRSKVIKARLNALQSQMTLKISSHLALFDVTTFLLAVCVIFHMEWEGMLGDWSA